MAARSIFCICPPTTPELPFLKSSSFPNFKQYKSLKIVKACLFKYPLASKIMVRNLPYSTSESSLQKEFSRFGKLAEVKLVKDEATNRSKGYAFIQYTSQEDALLALDSMDQKYFDGRLIFVELAKLRKAEFGGYLRTSGPPDQQHSPSQEDEE